MRELAAELALELRDGRLVRVQVERGDVLLGLERPAGLDGGEHELAGDLGVVLARTPVPDAEPDRVDGHAGARAAGPAPRRAPCPDGSRSAAVVSRRSVPSWSSATDSRATSMSGYQARGLPASSSPSAQTARSAARWRSLSSGGAASGSSSATVDSAARRRTISASATKARSLFGSSLSIDRSASSWSVSPRRAAVVGRRAPTREAEDGRRMS